MKFPAALTICTLPILHSQRLLDFFTVEEEKYWDRYILTIFPGKSSFMPMARPRALFCPGFCLRMRSFPGHNATHSCSGTCLQHLRTDDYPLLVYVGSSDSWDFGVYCHPLEGNTGADMKRNGFECWIHSLWALWPKLSFPHTNMGLAHRVVTVKWVHRQALSALWNSTQVPGGVSKIFNFNRLILS